MDMNTLSLALSALAALIAFLYVWARVTMGHDWDEFSASGLVLGWIPAAIVAAIAGAVAFGILFAGYFMAAGVGLAG